MNSIWTRRAWLTHTVANAAALTALVPRTRSSFRYPSGIALGYDTGCIRATPPAVRHAAQAARLDPGPVQALVLQAVDAAKAAGAQYADARLTRVVTHHYMMIGNGVFDMDTEEVGLGVRVLVHGAWGFAASPFWTPDDAERLARDAVRQATENAKGSPRVVDLEQVPVVTGVWATPVAIDPFIIPVEEKLDAIVYWKAAAVQAGVAFKRDGQGSSLSLARQERVVATSEGSLITQTLYESAGHIEIWDPQYSTDPLGVGNNGPTTIVHGLDVAGKGWELFLDAKIPEQFPHLKDEIHQLAMVGSKPATVGRYTVVCDGATMAALLGSTLGVATQLDRALGYEANAGGTSFIDDPLAMVGTFVVASPLVTVTANRSAPAQLATVRWDDEGVVPSEVTLLREGVLVDFQTTREQAAWLAPYYQRQGRPVRSNGCAAAEDAHYVTLQHQPNLSFEPSPSAIRLEDLVADVKDGILVERGGAAQVDFQARNGLLAGAMRRITNGRLGPTLEGGVVLFNTMDLYKHVMAVGGRSTQAVRGTTQYSLDLEGSGKGQPAQRTSHSVQAVAATILNQPLIDASRKA